MHTSGEYFCKLEEVNPREFAKSPCPPPPPPASLTRPIPSDLGCKKQTWTHWWWLRAWASSCHPTGKADLYLSFSGPHRADNTQTFLCTRLRHFEFHFSYKADGHVDKSLPGVPSSRGLRCWVLRNAVGGRAFQGRFLTGKSRVQDRLNCQRAAVSAGSSFSSEPCPGRNSEE